MGGSARLKPMGTYVSSGRRSSVVVPLRFVSVVLLGLLLACGRGAASQPDVQIALSVTPDPPVVGAATLVLTLRTADGQPLSGAQVRVEGTMSHAGMQPVLAGARETAPGRYEAPLTFTMAGEWYAIVRATLPDNRTLEREVQIGTVEGE